MADSPELKQIRRQKLRSNIIWIILVVMVWYELFTAILYLPAQYLIAYDIISLSDEMYFIVSFYTLTIFSVLALWILCCFNGNRYIWKSFLPAKKKGEPGAHERLSHSDFAIELYGRYRNTPRMLLLGLLLGFLTNFACILCALIHGDVKFYFDASLSQIPLFLFALISTFIQSSSEEMWCRGFLYERLHERYPLWVPIIVNGVFFGLLHMGNPSVTVLSIASITVCGISYSLLRWYSGNIWIAMGIHTGWNFTQNFLFGLPNSGLVSQLSLFHLNAANATSNLIYDYGFGVEGAIPAILMDASVGIVCLILAKRAGRIPELFKSRRQMYKEVTSQ